VKTIKSQKRHEKDFNGKGFTQGKVSTSKQADNLTIFSSTKLDKVT